MKLRRFMMIVLVAFILSGCAQKEAQSSEKTYEHVQFTSSIEKEQCALCGKHPDVHWSWYMDQENVAIVDVNTFDFRHIEINRYDDAGNQIKEQAGYMSMCGGQVGDSKISGMVDPDLGMARLDITPSDENIDVSAIEGFLCQECLDDFASHYYEHDNPYSLAVVNFATKTIRPIIESCPWYAADNYSIDFHFEDDGTIDLTVYYCPPRFSE